jgi:SRSO17 transposase
MDVDWQADLDRWLAPFVAALRHKTRARMCPLYVAGLIGPGDRKSVQPMAARASGVGYDQLHHFVAAGVWDSAPLEAALLKEADRLVGDDAGFLVIVDWSGSWQAAWLGNWLGWSPATKAALGR